MAHLLPRRRLAVLWIIGVCLAMSVATLLWMLQAWEADGSAGSHLTERPDLFTDFSHYNASQLDVPGPVRDPDSLRILIDEPDLCEPARHPHLRILHYVHSAPGNFQRRSFIRHTWSSPHLYPRLRMATVFFVGRPMSKERPDVQARILEESRAHGDLVQVDFEENYYHLTYKSVAALNWIHKRCLRADYVLKTDDDAFVDPFRLVDILLLGAGPPFPEDGIHCHAYHKFGPHRDPHSKWFVSTEEYPWDVYPDFCPGLAMYFPTSVVPKLLSCTSAVPFLKLDDVYLTGLLRHKAGVKLVNLGDHVNIYNGKDCRKGPHPNLFCHIKDIKHLWEVWVDVLTAELVRWLPWDDDYGNSESVATLYEMISRNGSISITT